jgi:hypothetical protein
LSTMDRRTCGGRMQKIEWRVAVHMVGSFVTIGMRSGSAGHEAIAFVLTEQERNAPEFYG